MLYLKKYLNEGLIQMAILLSLCGLRVEVGLEPAWQQSLLLGPSSTLTQTQRHNLHNLHPKTLDLDGFFTTRRLLGFVHSLDRPPVSHTDLEAWLVQREPDHLTVGLTALRDRAEQPSLLERSRPEPSPMERTPAGVEGDGLAPSVEDGISAPLEEEEENKETDSSLQECLQLLDETFPFTEEQQLRDVGGEDLQHNPPDREPLLPPPITAGNSPLDLELHWQDLLDIMDPENIEVDTMTSFDNTWNSGATRTIQGVRQNLCDNDNDVTEHGLFGPPNHSALEPTLLPLIPSAELDDQSLVLTNSNMNPLHSLPDHTNLLTADPSEDFSLGSQDLVDTIEGSPCSQYALYPDSLSSNDVNFHSCDLRPSSFAQSLESNGMTQDLLTSVFLVDENEDIQDEERLPSPLVELLEDAAILDEIRLLDLALEEGFSPEMAARMEEEGFLDPERAQQESMAFIEDHGQSRTHQQGENEADSDSGLSLDFSHSPASPCSSEDLSYSSSSSSSSSSCESAVGSPLSEDEDGEEGLVGSNMEVEVTIKEELEEENIGAVGGGYPEDVKKLFPSNYGDHMLFDGFPWLENIGHDHTYNQPWSSASSPPLGKIPTKHNKSSLQHDKAKPYKRPSSRHISESKMWGRDERRAKSLKVPFSNELIVNLPVEEFNDLLANYQLNEAQLTLIRDIRRRGKNKIAAQNCRKRKQDVMLDLKDDVSGTRRYRSRLLRERQEALRKLQDMKQQLGTLYQDVFSRLRDEEGRPLDDMEYVLHFEHNGSVTVTSRKEGAMVPATKKSKKPRDKKK